MPLLTPTLPEDTNTTHHTQDATSLSFLPPGARVGLLSRNSLFWAAAYLAILRSGLVAVPFATVLTPADVLRKARFVDCDSFLLDSGLSRAFHDVVTSAARVLSESALDGAEVALAFKTRAEWPRAFQFFPLYRA